MNDTFVCEQCNCIDHLELAKADPTQGSLKCTQCSTGKWHNNFPKRQYNPAYDVVINRPSGVSLG